MKLIVKSPNVKYTQDFIESNYEYSTNIANVSNDVCEVTPVTVKIAIKTQKTIPKLGLMLVGWGGNNGTTLTGAILANKHKLTWKTKEGTKVSNYFGSITQSTTISIGLDKNDEVYLPMKDILPLLDPNDIIIDGWDISSVNMGDAIKRAKVFDFNLQEKLIPMMKDMKPKASIYIPHFIAANQEGRADNVLTGGLMDQMNQIRKDIKDFKTSNGLNKVIVLWTANTECFAEIKVGINTTVKDLENAISHNSPDVSPSTLFAYASIMESCTFINGSPQNTFVPGLIELAKEKNVFISGDDFKSGQTKVKSVLVDFLVSAGIKPLSIVSYNHLGNNDGYNLSSPAQFRSKEISKSSVVDDVVKSNKILYPNGEKPDHCIVIKYVPTVGDSKRAMDEYVSELMMGGINTLAIHNTCEDSLLAAPIILDLVILSELCQRILFKVGNDNWKPFNHILSILSYLCKAPLVPQGTPVINALFKQKACIDNFFRACVGLAPEHHMLLEYKLDNMDTQILNKTRSSKEVSKTNMISSLDHPHKKFAHGGY